MAPLKLATMDLTKTHKRCPKVSLRAPFYWPAYGVIQRVSSKVDSLSSFAARKIAFASSFLISPSP